MSLRSLPNRHVQRGLGAESGRRWASMNLSIILAVGWQAHCDAGKVSANASVEVNGLELTEVRLIEPTNLLVGSPELWKFRRINVSIIGG